MDGTGFETRLVSARRPHVLGSAGSHVPQWTPRVHSQQEGAFPQRVQVVTPGAEERVSTSPRHVSRGRVPLSQPVSPSSSMLIVSHLHVNNTCGCEVRAHRRVCLGCLPQGAGVQGHSRSLTLPPALLCCHVSFGTKQRCLSCTLNRGRAPCCPTSLRKASEQRGLWISRL